MTYHPRLAGIHFLRNVVHSVETAPAMAAAIDRCALPGAYTLVVFSRGERVAQDSTVVALMGGAAALMTALEGTHHHELVYLDSDMEEPGCVGLVGVLVLRKPTAAL